MNKKDHRDYVNLFDRPSSPGIAFGRSSSWEEKSQSTNRTWQQQSAKKLGKRKSETANCIRKVPKPQTEFGNRNQQPYEQRRRTNEESQE